MSIKTQREIAKTHKEMARQLIIHQIEMKTDFTTLNAIREILKDDGFSMDHQPTIQEPYLKLGTPSPSMLLFIDDTHIYLSGPNIDTPGNNTITLDLADPKVFEKVKHHYHHNKPK